MLKDQPMKKICITALILAVVSAVSCVHADTFTENFATDPSQNGWQIFGDTNLFQWDSTNHDLAVTWDSSQPNSYFYRPLSNILTGEDDFQFSFDLTINNLTAGVNPDKSDALEVGVGFLNFADATGTNFIRGLNPLNVSEFDYFPYFVDPDFGPINPSISQVMISTNGNYYGAFGYFITLTNGVSYNVQTSYSAGTGVLVATVTLTGQTNVLVTAVTSPMITPGDDFRVDTFSISSYSDTGDPYDSLYGQGTISNLTIVLPPPPVQNLTLSFSNSVPQTQFTSRSNWLYTLQRTADFQSWQPVSDPAPGTGTNLVLQDTNPPPAQAFYRINSARP
jgi:hypothetical protein